MVRDLVETSIDMVREEKLDEVADRAEQAAGERVLDLLLPPQVEAPGTPDAERAALRAQIQRTREKLRVQLREGQPDQGMAALEIPRRRVPSFENYPMPGAVEK